MSLSFDANNIDYLGKFTLEPHEISFSNKGNILLRQNAPIL